MTAVTYSFQSVRTFWKKQKYAPRRDVSLITTHLCLLEGKSNFLMTKQLMLPNVKNLPWPHWLRCSIKSNMAKRFNPHRAVQQLPCKPFLKARVIQITNEALHISPCLQLQKCDLMPTCFLNIKYIKFTPTEISEVCPKKVKYGQYTFVLDSYHLPSPDLGQNATLVTTHNMFFGV